MSLSSGSFFLKEGISSLPSFVLKNISPSVWSFKSTEKSGMGVSISFALEPSPSPFAPWQDLQCLSNKPFPADRDAASDFSGFLAVFDFSGTTHGFVFLSSCVLFTNDMLIIPTKTNSMIAVGIILLFNVVFIVIVFIDYLLWITYYWY